MATISLDKTVGKGPTKGPVSLHPAFPAVVALWFAALLGFGSLVLPGALLDRVVEATGLAFLLPAASPPLGVTARSLIALAAAVSGAVLGLSIARRVAQSHMPTAHSRLETLTVPSARRPISAHDELGDEGLDGTATPRRRSLAMAEDNRRSDYLWLVPVPGAPAEDGGPQGALFPSVDQPESDDLDVLELEALAPAPVETAPQQTPELAGELAEPLGLDAVLSDEPIVAPALLARKPIVAAKPVAAEIERRRLERRSAATGKGPGGFERRLYLRRDEDEPMPFVSPSLARLASDNENTPLDVVDVKINFARPVASVSTPIPASAEVDAMVPAIDEPLTLNEVTATGEAIEPTDDLGLVQLVQKLASTLEARRDQIATQAAAVQASANVSPVMAAAELVASEAFEAAPADEAMEAMAAYFGRPAEIEPDAFAQPAPVPSFGAGLLARHFESEEDEDSDNSDFAAGFSLPLATNIFASEPELSTEEAVGDEASGEDDEPEYGSLLGMRNPFLGKTEEFVRIEEPAPLDDDILPEVVFPTAQPTAARTSMARPFDAPAGKTPSVEPQARATPTVEADDALRRALETLQRMSSNG